MLLALPSAMPAFLLASGGREGGMAACLPILGVRLFNVLSALLLCMRELIYCGLCMMLF